MPIEVVSVAEKSSKESSSAEMPFEAVPVEAVPAGAGPLEHVVVVPGFFGFGSLGELSYFDGIRPLLESRFARAGVRLQITEVSTPPTASLRVRAARVRDTLAAIVAQGGERIHIIGHSTGGLDARLALAPTASLPGRARFEGYDRVRTLITVCCAHFGSPVATFFSGWLGRWVLRVGSRYLIWALERGRLPLAFALRCAHGLLGLWRPFRNRPNTFDELFTKIARDLSDERRAELINFLRAVSDDEALVFQLTPAGCDVLNACTAEPNVRYGSVVARAARPRWRGFWSCFGDPYAMLAYPLYAFLYRLAARHEARWIPEAVGKQCERLLEFYGELPSPHDNDGVSPTNSQVWGELVHATTADHLDVVGHFGSGERGGHAGDWLPSHSGFDAERFERLWHDVATFILDDAKPGALVSGDVEAGVERTASDLREEDAPHPRRAQPPIG
jgi:triacylglycerol lipase